MTTELLTCLLDDILKFEPNRYLALRDLIVLCLGFLLGLRALDISVINTDSVLMLPGLHPNSCACDVLVKDGKSTKDERHR